MSARFYPILKMHNPDIVPRWPVADSREMRNFAGVIKMVMIKNILLVGIGGATGAMLRYIY